MMSFNPFDFKSLSIVDVNHHTIKNHHDNQSNYSSPSIKNKNASCVACFKRHLECSSDKPTCSNCLEMNLSCEYLSSRKVARRHRHKLNYPITGGVGNEIQTPFTKTNNKKRTLNIINIKDEKVHSIDPFNQLHISTSTSLSLSQSSKNHDVIDITNDNEEYQQKHQKHQKENMVQQSSSNDIALIPLSKMIECENKIYSIYFDLLDHTTTELHPCIVRDSFKLIQNVMTNYIKSNSQLQRISNAFQDRVQKLMSGHAPLDVLHSCQHCVSLDIDNDSFDYFACNPSPTLQSAIHKHSTRCALHLMRTNNILNTNPCIFIDYTIDGSSSSSSSSSPSISPSTLTSTSTLSSIVDDGLNNKKGNVTPIINKGFQQMFGYNQDQISQYISHFADGLLPFCGDIFSLLMDDTNQIKRIIHRFAIKISQAFKEYYAQVDIIPNSCYTVESLFEVGTIKNPLYIKNNQQTMNNNNNNNNNNMMIPCKCQILARYIFVEDGSYGGTQIHINFVPIESPINHVTSEVSIPNTICNESSDDDDNYNDEDDDESWIDSVIENLMEESNRSDLSPTPSELTL